MCYHLIYEPLNSTTHYFAPPILFTLCASAVQLHFSSFLCVFAIQRITPAYPPNLHQRRTRGSISRILRHFSGFSRASTLHFVSIQRFLPYFPPDISAENVQFLQQLQHLQHAYLEPKANR